MLILALAATIVGFVLLVVGLITGTVWLAVACIAVCLIGLIFLVADIISAGRKGRSGGSTDAESSGGFGFGDTAERDRNESSEGQSSTASGPMGERALAGHADDVDQSAAETTAAIPIPASLTQEEDRAALWQGVVTPRSDDTDSRGVETGIQPEGAAPTQAVPAQPVTAERGYADYLKSVGAADMLAAPEASPAPASPAVPPRQAVPQPPAPQAEPAQADSAPPTPQPTQKFDPLDPRWCPPLD